MPADTREQGAANGAGGDLEVIGLPGPRWGVIGLPGPCWGVIGLLLWL